MTKLYTIGEMSQIFKAKTEKISVDSEISDDGRLISTLEIIIAKISS